MTKCNKMDNNFVLGNSVDIKLTCKDVAEVRADVVVESSAIDEKCNVIRLWGQIKDCNGNSIAGALLKLIRVICSQTSEYYEGVAHTVSDCNGFYQFDLCYCDGNELYKVLVNKSYTGAEQIIDTGTGNCNACENGNENSYYDPCKIYAPIVTPHESCCDRPITTPNNPCEEHYDRPQCERPVTPTSPTNPCREHYNRPQCERPVTPTPCAQKPSHGCQGSNYAQSINMPLYGCK